MKSSLFSTYDLANSAGFPKDIQALFRMDADVVARLPGYALRALETPTRAESENVYKAAADDLGVVRSQLGRALDVAQFFLREFAPKGEAASDDPEALVSDLKELFDLPDEKSGAISSFLKQLKESAQDRLRLTLLQQAHAQSTLPTLEAVSVQVDFRAVFEETYKYDEDVSGFSPKFLGTVPLGIVGLRIRGGETERVSLQLSKRTLQILIDNLVALQKEIDVAENNITCNGS